MVHVVERQAQSKIRPPKFENSILLVGLSFCCYLAEGWLGYITFTRRIMVTLPGTIAAPLPADSLDNEIVINRNAVIAVGTLGNSVEGLVIALTARVSVLETKPSPVVTVSITAAQEAALIGISPGSVAILQGPGTAILLQRV